jgi:arylsulfatase A-like enzyme
MTVRQFPVPAILSRPAFPALVLLILLSLLVPAGADAPRRPNVVLIITDDQGYGDLGAHGNRMIRTPHLDRLHSESVRLTNFHVDPTCAPTRAALLTGRYSTRTGVWHTIAGRSLMAHDEVTLPQLFKKAGYRTGLFGKWHLGDSYPMRPQDRGFDEVLTHGGGGVTQTPDYWSNDYFDDTYLHNGKPEKQSGYCTDVWFSAASRFVDANRNRPFFLYVAPNAPHSPYNVADHYAEPYRKQRVPEPMASFYGMITNIDENVGALRKQLADRGLERNTLFIFMTDNGTAAGAARRAGDGEWPGFSAGMRAAKGSEYEGGHRVPCFVYSPEGGFGPARDLNTLAAHVDLMPTLGDLCSLKLPQRSLDGTSLAPLLRREKVEWADRMLFVHSQRVQEPVKWKQSAVLTQQWRLVNGKELYDLPADPGQIRDVAADHPEVVARLRKGYEAWWEDLSPAFARTVPIIIGHPTEPTVTLNAHDWHAPDAQVPWNHELIKQQRPVNGWWQVEVAREGEYEFTLRSWPFELRDAPTLPAGSCRLAVGVQDVTTTVPAGAAEVKLRLNLPRGPARLQTWLKSAAGEERGAFYVATRRVR